MMKGVSIVLLTTFLRAEAACPCKTTTNTTRTAAAGKPAYPGQVAAYGWNCSAHDKGYDVCNASTPGYAGAAGQKDDWCNSKWCIVDPSTCDFKTRKVTYTAEPNDYFSYEACDTNFNGNAWVGRCKNCDAPHFNSFCTCGGLAGCKCLPGAQKQENATGKPAYPGQVPAYGSGCKAHDAGYDACNATTAGYAGAAGQKDDWCNDKWCFVDPAACNLKTRLVSYTKNPTDYFSYETCDASFTGNGWVGRCKNCAAPYVNNSYCTCAANTTQKIGTTNGASGMVATSIPVLLLLSLAK